MPEAATSPADEQAGRGAMAELLGFAGTFGRHLQALAALASFETREAAGVYLRVVIALVAGIVCAVFAYLLLLLFVAFLAATVFHINWIWIALGLSLLHLAGAGACAWFIRARLKTPVFASTNAELRRDFDAMANFKP